MDKEIHSAERYRPVRLITVKGIAKVDTFLDVSIGNKIVTSSLPATECALVQDMQTEAETPNMNRMFIGPCIIVIVEELKTNLMSLVIFMSLIICSTCFGH